jgi:hypothetical protein
MHIEKLPLYQTRLDEIPKDQFKTPETEIGLHCVCIAIGVMKSGKTMAIRSKLLDLKKAVDGQCYNDRTFVISPTAGSHINKKLFEKVAAPEDIYEEPTYESYSLILDKIREEGEKWDEYKEKLRIYELIQRYIRTGVPIEKWDEQILMAAHTYSVIDEKPTHPYGHAPRLHVWLDDVQSSQLFTPSCRNVFLQNVTKHRHISYGYSIFLSVQNYSGHGCLPKTLRQMLSLAMIYKPADQGKKLQISQELATEVDKNTFLEALDLACKTRHDFLLVDLQPKQEKYRFRKNWNELIVVDSVTKNSEEKSKPKEKTHESKSDFVPDN